MVNPHLREKLKEYLKPLYFTHLQKMTTAIGLIQHSAFDDPDLRFGYSIDDNARGVMAILEYDEFFKTNYFDSLGKYYLDYIFRAQKVNGAYHNFANKGGKFIDEVGSLDSQGRTLWALGFVAGRAKNIDSRLKSKAKNEIATFNFYQPPALRSQAFALLGYVYIKDKRKAEPIIKDLIDQYQKNKKTDWRWFEDDLTYSNAIIPLALLRAGIEFKNPKAILIAKESFLWLDKVSRVDGIPAPIGSFGWYTRGGLRAIYDQQVVDIADMILFATDYFDYSGDERFLTIALEWMNWFTGNNLEKTSLISFDGGIYDGIVRGGINSNKGAESNVMYHLAYLALTKLAVKYS